jgi:hypothetical protein
MWTRLGKVLEPPRFAGWAASHAMVPFLGPPDSGAGPEPTLVFSTRDERGRSHTGRARLALRSDGGQAVADHVPLLGPGPLGGFDDSGAMGSCLVVHDDRQYLYYIGWALGVTVPFATYVGLAVSEDDGQTFRRAVRGPVVGRTASDPFLATSPWVRIENDVWRMWYASGDRWEETPTGPKHYYRIMYAESHDGLTWTPTGRVCIDFADETEYAIARPCVLRDQRGYHMWFSCRGSAYRIEYATSDDGLTWERHDDRERLEPAREGWDGASVEYGCVFDHDGERLMLYNGDDYGRTGIGLARWIEASP